MKRIRRREGEPTLVQALAAALDGRTMTVAEAGKAVRRAGYRTACRNFRVPVAMALSKGPFRRVAPGRYTAVGAPEVAGPSPLVTLLERLLRGRTMSVSEATKAVRAAGYRGGARSLYSAVGNVLAMKPQFRRVARGRYAADRRRRVTGPGSRAPRAGSVVSILQGLLKSKTMTVTEAVAAVRTSGYKTKATPKSFYHAVAIALSKSGRFSRISRGKYRTR